MKVRIIKCSHSLFWYAGKVGRVFDVVVEHENWSATVNLYCEAERAWIARADCDILEDIRDDSEIEQKLRGAVAFFETAELPTASIKLSDCETIVNLPRFIDTTITTLRSFWKNKEFRKPYLERFLAVYDLIKNKTYVESDIKPSPRKIELFISHKKETIKPRKSR